MKTGRFGRKTACFHWKVGKTGNWTLKCSDGHGFENLCGFTGMGHAGTGTGDQIVTRDIPVPVWVGDRYVTGT